MRRTCIAIALCTIAVADEAPLHAGEGKPIGLGATAPLLWRVTTASPEPLTGTAGDDALYKVCGEADAGLRSVAARNAARMARGEPSFPSDELSFTLRAAGLPYVWPRAWSMRGKELDEDDVAAELGKFVAKSRALGQRRCGVVRFEREGITYVSAILVDVLADLDPTPTLARVGEWVSIKGHMLVTSSEAKVVLLGPRGAPKTVLASLSGDEVRASFSVDQPGPWIVQVLANSATGPRPVLEAHIMAGGAAPTRFAESAAPGEDAGEGTTDAESVLAMLNAARKSEGLKLLQRDTTLDKIAQDHSVLMRDQRTVGHDVGDGELSDRLTAANVTFRLRGENLAAAATPVRAHRALWLSPSHRANLLDTRYSRVGIGVAKSDDGRLWVTEVFVD